MRLWRLHLVDLLVFVWRRLRGGFFLQFVLIVRRALRLLLVSDGFVGGWGIAAQWLVEDWVRWYHECVLVFIKVIVWSVLADRLVVWRLLEFIVTLEALLVVRLSWFVYARLLSSISLELVWYQNAPLFRKVGRLQAFVVRYALCVFYVIWQERWALVLAVCLCFILVVDWFTDGLWNLCFVIVWGGEQLVWLNFHWFIWRSIGWRNIRLNVLSVYTWKVLLELKLWV